MKHARACVDDSSELSWHALRVYSPQDGQTDRTPTGAELTGSLRAIADRSGAAGINLLTPNVDYSGRTAPLTYMCCNLYIYSTNICTENFKHGIYSPFFPLQSAVCFVNLTYLVPVLFTFCIQGVLKLKKNNSGAKRF